MFCAVKLGAHKSTYNFLPAGFKWIWLQICLQMCPANT